MKDVICSTTYSQVPLGFVLTERFSGEVEWKDPDVSLENEESDCDKVAKTVCCKPVAVRTGRELKHAPSVA